MQKYLKPPVIIARLFHWEMEFTDQAGPENPIWSSKEIHFTFESTGIKTSNVGISVIYMVAPDKQRTWAPSSQCPFCFSFFIPLIFLPAPQTNIYILYSNSIFSTCFFSNLFDSITHTSHPLYILTKNRLLKD